VGGTQRPPGGSTRRLHLCLGTLRRCLRPWQSRCEAEQPKHRPPAASATPSPG